MPRRCGEAGTDASIDEIIAARIAAELGNDSFASAGAVSPLANVAYRLAKATHAPDMMIATMTCGHLDIAPSPMILSLIESLDAETAVAHAGGDDTYSTYYQPGAVTHEIVAAAQVDRRGRVNTIALRKRDGGFIRLPGQGGMADVANMHRDYLLYITRHSTQSIVDEVEIASSARGLLTQAEREPRGYRTGRALVITDLCVFQLDPSTRELVVVETMPGITREQIRDATGFAVKFDADCRELPSPPPRRLRSCGIGSIRWACAGWSSSAPGSAETSLPRFSQPTASRSSAVSPHRPRHAAKPAGPGFEVHDEAVARHVCRTGLFRRHLHGPARRASRRRRGPSRRLDLVRHRDRRSSAHGRRWKFRRTHGRHRRLPARHRLRQRRQLLCLRSQACVPFSAGMPRPDEWSASPRPASACRTIR